MPQDYNNTINLPKTEFPMRASLPKREPEMLAAWQERGIYGKLIAKNEGKPRFILHDGPPFSNGYIHMGTAMNKCLKDFICRYKNMSGYQAPYVPGWDNHGMPIESAIIKQRKLDRKKMSVTEFRDACRDFAWKFVNIQRDQFIRLGVLGDWENPYLTMDPAFEAEEVRVFGAMYKKGFIYKGKKPVYWCPQDETALAEAEIEYADDKCESIYVKFALKDDKGLFGGEINDTYVVIWTTTTWTLPGNLAISVGPDFDYVLIEAKGERYIVAKELASPVMKAAGIGDYRIIKEFKGRELEFCVARHPFFERDSLIILGDHVTLDAGTGCVHTAPGHGMEDFVVCKLYDDTKGTNIGVVVPVDDRGIMTEEAGPVCAGMHYSKANEAILEELRRSGALLASETIVHQYPHCWRCKKPIVYRATDQWFCSVDAIKESAVRSCADVRWIPDWGRERMEAMIRERADWCISRQRHWGLPIPVFYCSECGKPVCTDETIEAVANLFSKRGSNAWFDTEAKDILPPGFKCPHCSSDKGFIKDTNTLDGWFDSGSTHIAALERRNPGDWPADMYLEGADQYRGWFQSSLLTSIATRGKPPFGIVLTHGWTVDGEGKAMHKSLGNSILPDQLIPKYGADILRLWAASSDYRNDVRCSDNIFRQLSDMYLKIRNTARYMLGNLSDFNPDDPVPYEEMLELDKWALDRFTRLAGRVKASYEEYEFHPISHAIHNFCVVDMSNFYLDVIKDRLYCDAGEGLSRRSAQTAMYIILDGMVRMLAPILAFTSEEVWAAMPHAKDADPESVLFNEIPGQDSGFCLSAEALARWDKLIDLRDEVNKALEDARNEKKIGKPLEAVVTLSLPDDPGADEKTLAEIFIVSKVILEKGEKKINVARATAPKCPRCWVHTEEPDENGLCPRCSEVVSSIIPAD
ncbi:MAG: isoleucine--tRNA ligase [Oscillospiraceae bacterium]|jgi:isoleucyl-tRNA synthetase